MNNLQSYLEQNGMNMIRLYVQDWNKVMFNEDRAKEVFKKEGINAWGFLHSETHRGKFSNLSDFDIAEYFFSLTNTNSDFQRFLQLKVRLIKSERGFGHTSMSVGDIVSIERNGSVKNYLCADAGFEEIKK